MSDESPWHSTPELRASAEHNLTDSRTKMQLYWAATEIERLEGLTMDLTDALWNWWGDGSDADDEHDEHADWCDVPADCLCGRSLFPEGKTNE